MTKTLAIVCLVVIAFVLGETQARAQARDGLLNGAVIGAAIGAGVGVALTHATRDSELGVSQYAQGAIIFGGLGAGIGLGVDALFHRGPSVSGIKSKKILIAPAIWRGVRGVAVNWRF
jgi:hypothetical protein